MQTKDEPRSEREIVLTRVVEAPRALVFEVWTDPRHVPRWWGPTGFTTRTQRMDVRVGGEWIFTFVGPDGREYPNHVRYLAVEAPARLAYEHVGEAGTDPVCFGTEVTFEELGPSATRVTLRAQFPSRAARDHAAREFGAIEGGRQTLERMAEHTLRLLRAETGSAPFELHRVLNAPRELVYEAWTRPEHLAQWFGPKGCRLSVERFELRPGGHFHYGMHFPGGAVMWGRWIFDEIVPNERLVFRVGFADAAGESVRAPHDVTWPLWMHSVVTFERHAGIGGGTVVRLLSSAHRATPEEQRTFDAGHDSMRGGWGGTFDMLAGFLAEQTTGKS